MMERLNCLRCAYRHEDNGNCMAVGGFCTAVPAAHCRLLQEYLGTGLTPEEIDMDHEAAEQLRCLCRDCDLDRLEELAKADKEGRVVVLPCKVGDTLLDQTSPESPTLMKNIRVEIAYESICGIIFHMGHGIFADLVEHGRIKPVSEEAEEALRRAENGNC